MQARRLLSHFLVTTAFLGGTLAVVPASPSHAEEVCSLVQVGWDNGPVYQEKCWQTTGTTKPKKTVGTVAPKQGDPGGAPIDVLPKIVWDYTWRATQGCDNPNEQPVEGAPEEPPLGIGTHTPRWDIPSNQPFPPGVEVWSSTCIPEPADPPATPPDAPPDPPLPDNWWADGQAQLGLTAGDIWTDYQHAFLTGTTASFAYTVDASAVTAQMSGSGFTGAINAQLIGVSWDIDGSGYQGISVSHPFRHIGDGVAPVEAIATWEIWGYAYSPQGTLYEWRITVQIPSSMSRPVNQIISARTEPQT